MFVLEVIPFSRTSPGEALSYRSSVRVAVGSLVRVPLRRKSVLGLVTNCIPVHEAKYMLKSASFTLSKSIDTLDAKIPEATICAAKRIATYHATTLGAALAELIMPVIPSDESALTSIQKISLGAGFLEERLEAPMKTRVGQYAEGMRDAAGVALLVVPTLAEATEWSLLLKDLKPIMLTGKTTGLRRDKVLQSLLNSPHEISSARVIITTPTFAAGLVALSAHISDIFIERISAGSYTLLKRPYIDVRRALTYIAQERAISITYGDYPLPLEYRENPSSATRHPQTCDVEIYDSRLSPGEDAKWNALAPALIKHISETLEKGGRVGVLAVRRGYAPVVVCRDCGTAVTDEYGRNLTLSISGTSRVFRSSDGTIIQSTNVLCKNCESWNLMPLGIGIERVEEELRKAFPKSPITRIDADSTSPKSLVTIQEKIATPGTIVIGTEVMLSWLPSTIPLDLAIIASADSLLALPFWRSRERFVRVGLMLAERATKLIVATRMPDDIVMSAIQSPNESLFWNEESALRKLLTYPPFGTLIVLHAEASKNHIQRLKQEVLRRCDPFVPVELPDRAMSRGTVRAIFVLQIPQGSWPDTALSERLSQLPPSVTVHIDSESFW